MCALCGVLFDQHWAEQDGGRRARVFRVKLANRVLDHFGLRLDDWGGRVYVLRDGKVTWTPAVDATKIILGAQLVAAAALLTIRAVIKARHPRGDRRKTRRG